MVLVHIILPQPSQSWR